jgi:hypothetical protein
MTRPALIAVCLFAFLGTWNAQVQSEEPDEIDRRELRELRDRIAGLEYQIKELKQALHKLSKAKLGNSSNAPVPSDEESESRLRPLEEERKLRRSTFADAEEIEEESDPIPPARSRFTPRIKEPCRTAPAPAVPKHWQRLEINGQAFYIIPVGEIPGGDAPVVDGRLTPIRERREE